MIEMGLLVAIGLVTMFAKLSWRKRMWLLSRPLLLDVTVFIGLNALHWGTFSGVMIAAIGALACSMLISFGRKAFGYIEKNVYFPGWLNISHKL